MRKAGEERMALRAVERHKDTVTSQPETMAPAHGLFEVPPC